MAESEQEEALWRITERYVAELKAGRKPRLQEYLTAYPRYASAIADFVAYYQALELQLPEEDLTYVPPGPDGGALLQRSLQQARLPSEPLSSLLSSRRRGVLTSAQLAHELDISEDIVVLLEQRQLAEETIPPFLIERLALVLQQSEEMVHIFLRQPVPPATQKGIPTRRVAESSAPYAQDRSPQTSSQSFLRALEESKLATRAQKLFWREIVREEQQ